MSFHKHCIFEQWVCAPLDGPSSEFFETHKRQENWQLSSLLCSVVQHRRKICVQRRQDTTCAIVFWFHRIAFLVYNTLIVTFFQELGVMESCLMIKFMTSRINSVVSSSVSLRSLALIPLEPTDFIFDLVNSDFWRLYCIFHPRNFHFFHLQQNRIDSRVFRRCPCRRLLSSFLLEYRASLNFANVFVIPFLDALMSPTSFLMRVIRNLSPVLLFSSVLIPLNCSRILCTVSCFFVLLLSLNPCLIFLLMSFAWAFTFQSYSFFFRWELWAFLLFSVNLFFSLSCCRSRVLLLCFSYLLLFCCCHRCTQLWCFSCPVFFVFLRSVPLPHVCLWTCSQVQHIFVQVRALFPLTREFRLLRLSPHASCIEYSCEDFPSVSGPCFEFRVERHVVLYHQPLLHPNTTLVGFSQRVLSNVVTFGSTAKHQLGV